jgi:hypothetical protein
VMLQDINLSHLNISSAQKNSLRAIVVKTAKHFASRAGYLTAFVV